MTQSNISLFHYSGPSWSQTKKHLIRKIGQFRLSCAYARGQFEPPGSRNNNCKTKPGGGKSGNKRGHICTWLPPQFQTVPRPPLTPRAVNNNTHRVWCHILVGCTKCPGSGRTLLKCLGMWGEYQNTKHIFF